MFQSLMTIIGKLYLHLSKVMYVKTPGKILRSSHTNKGTIY